MLLHLDLLSLNVRRQAAGNRQCFTFFMLTPSIPPLVKEDEEGLGDQGVDLGFLGPLAIRIIPLQGFQA